MTVTVRYFAMLREQSGLDVESVETDPATAEELYARLRERHGFTLRACMVRAAVNGTFVEPSHALRNGDEVVFIPPVAGG